MIGQALGQQAQHRFTTALQPSAAANNPNHSSQALLGQHAEQQATHQFATEAVPAKDPHNRSEAL